MAEPISLHPIFGLFLLVVGVGNAFDLGDGPETLLLLAGSSRQCRAPVLAAGNHRASESFEMVWSCHSEAASQLKGQSISWRNRLAQDSVCVHVYVYISGIGESKKLYNLDENFPCN